jgi:RES domain-containing protein
MDPETALAEVLHHQRYLGARLAELTPLTLVSLEATMHRLLDLTAANVQNLLGVTRDQMLAPWRLEQHAGREALTQAIGRLARAAGFEGLIVPSAALSTGTNLVIFPGRESPGSRFAIVNPDQLPLFRRRFGRRKKI